MAENIPSLYTMPMLKDFLKWANDVRANYPKTWALLQREAARDFIATWIVRQDARCIDLVRQSAGAS